MSGTEKCSFTLLGLTLLAAANTAQADTRTESLASSEANEAAVYKLTTALYRTGDGYLGGDVNLRAGMGPHVVWAGFYRSETGFEQGRTGYENTAVLPFGKLVSSLQFATRGFAGAAATAELGGDHYFLLGLSRTNLRDYYNLTFDPNDSVLYGIGSHTLIPQTQAYLFSVKDNRLDTGQRVSHLVLRYQSGDKSRWTLDLSQKSGQGEGEEKISATGVTLGYDFDRYFVRAAYDPKVNFTVQNMARVSLGMRF
ncbi:MAG: hypothetical protein KGZ83_15385 [Sulfuricella sp.]|nr:hypothetical protein [Sulfuricella sp.]